jgi:hypothetical protein
MEGVPCSQVVWGGVTLRGPGACQFAVHTLPGNGSRLTPNFRYGNVKIPGQHSRRS